jgi:hypothetical protein
VSESNRNEPRFVDRSASFVRAWNAGVLATGSTTTTKPTPTLPYITTWTLALGSGLIVTERKNTRGKKTTPPLYQSIIAKVGHLCNLRETLLRGCDLLHIRLLREKLESNQPSPSLKIAADRPLGSN